MNIIRNDDWTINFGELGSCNSVWLTLTNLCNIHCKYCFNYLAHCHEHMSARLTLAIINAHLSNFHDNTQPIHLNYFGGEPTLNNEALLQAVNFNLESDVNCEQYLMTNGVIGKELLSQLIDKKIDFQISFDGQANNLRFNKALNKEIHEQTIKTIKMLSSKKERIVIRSTIHKDNVANMPDMVRFCDKHQIRELKFAPVCNFGDAQLNEITQPTVDLYMDNFLRAYQLSNYYGIELEVKGLRYFNELHQKLNIPMVWLPDGFVAMTITYATSKAKGAEKIIIGRFNEETGRIELNPDKIHSMKENFIKNKERYCTDCPIKDICKGAIHFSPFSTDTFIPERDRYFCHLANKMVTSFPA